MAAANIACLLSRRTDVKRGILVVDWDLDAPGLHWFFVTNPAGVGEELRRSREFTRPCFPKLTQAF
jgi:hypothetical protein